MQSESSCRIFQLSPAAQSLLLQYRFSRNDEINTSIVYTMPIEKGFFAITPLCAAAIAGDLNVAKEIIDNGGKLEVTTGRSPLHWATCYGRLSLVKYFLNQGADTETVPLDQYKGYGSIFTFVWAGYESKVAGKEANISGAVQAIEEVIILRKKYK